MSRLVLCTLLSIFLTSASPEAKACVCGSEPGGLSADQVRSSVAQQFGESVAVFSGEVTSRDTFEVAFKVEDVWKGGPKDVITMSTGARKLNEELISVSDCDYRFEVGQKYLVFSKRDGELIVAHKCGWTQPLEDSENVRRILEEIKVSGERSGGEGAKSNKMLKPTRLKLAFYNRRFVRAA